MEFILLGLSACVAALCAMAAWLFLATVGWGILRAILGEIDLDFRLEFILGSITSAGIIGCLFGLGKIISLFL